MVNINSVLKINDLKDLSLFLNGETLEYSEIDAPLYYVQDDMNGYFIYDSSIPTYYKVPELASPRFLQNAKLLMAKNNRYIPIVDKDTEEVLFTEDEFLSIRDKMTGLSRYGLNEYHFSSNLDFPGIEDYVDVIDSNKEKIATDRTFITDYISNILSSIGLSLGQTMGEGDIELFDTGSTARGTNLPDEISKSDFDFILRADGREIEMVRRLLIDNLHTLPDVNNMYRNNRIRLKDVIIPGLLDTVDIDISFIANKKIYYSTDESLRDRLNTIKEQDAEGYKKVVANIMHAKKLLKKYGVYKPSRSDKNQAGLGGIGIENWILQHGGSFIDAARDFMEHAEGKSFLEFESEYPIYDFGKNHVSIARNIFPYDNFVMKNMREIGFYKMQKCLVEYIQEMDYSREQSIKL